MSKGKISYIQICENFRWNRINAFPEVKTNQCSTLSKKLLIVHGPRGSIWAVLEMEKEPTENSGENLNEEHPLAEISQLLDQVLIL